MVLVFSDVGGTLFEGAPWGHMRQHPLWNQARGNWELLKFIPTMLGTKTNLISETTMRQRWLKGMAHIFKDKTRQQLQTVYCDTLENELKPLLRADVIARLQQHKADGATVILVSGIFTGFVQCLAQSIGLDGAIGTRIQFHDDKVTGELDGIPCVGAQKITYIQQFIAQHHPQTDLNQAYAYADSHSDRALLSFVGNPVATYPDSKIRQLARQNNWEIMPQQ